MKKQALLTAAAVSTIILAGAAQAGEITAVKVGTVATSSTDAYTLASELKLGTGVTFAKANNELTLDPTTGDLPAGTYLFSFALTGGSFLTTGVTAADLDVNTVGTCTTGAPVVSTLSASTISFIVTANGDCSGDTDGIASVTFDYGFKVATAGTVSVTGTITSGGNPVDGGPSAAFKLVDFAKGFEALTASSGGDTTALLADDFTTISGGDLGDVIVRPIAYASNTVYSNTAGDDVDLADITDVIVELTGSTQGLDITIEGQAPEEEDAAPLVFDLTPDLADGVYDVAATPDASGDPIRTSSYSAKITYELDTQFTGPLDSPKTGDLDSVVREGTNVLVPWVASGTLAGNTQSETVIRISNIGNSPTGAVTAELLTSSNNAATGGLFDVDADGIPAGGELVITSGAFQNGVFGTDFGRADINLTIEANSEDIVIRRFIRNTVNNVLTEVSLGRTSFFGSTGGLEPVN